MERKTVSDHLIDRISKDGVDTIFGVTGGGIMHLVDSISRSKNIKLICTHHEEFAGVAADGYARTGKPYGVAIGTTGPGAAHLFTAIAAAWQDSSPVLFIVGQVKTEDSLNIQNLTVRQNGTFEFDTTKAFATIAKKVLILEKSKEAPERIEQAIRLMQEGRPGPVVIEIPLDIQGEEVENDKDKRQLEKTSDQTEIDISTAKNSILTALKKAKRPLVLLGIGCIRSRVNHQIVEALEKAQIPYICTQFAREGGRRTDQLFMGSPGIKGNRCANLAMMKCDTLIALGTSLHQQVIGWDSEQFKNSPSWKIWFEIDPNTQSARSKLVNEAFLLSAQDASKALISEAQKITIEKQDWKDWNDLLGLWKSKYMLHYPNHEQCNKRICLYRLVSVLDKHAEKFSAVVTDAGQAWYALAQHYFLPEGSHYISSGSFGAMGMALPLAIGAASATKRTVLALTGDGSAMMSLSELATLKAQNLPVVLVINNNNGYVSIRSTHDRYFDGRKIGTDSSNGLFIPEFNSIASTFGIPYRAAHTEKQLEEIMNTLPTDKAKGPTIIDVYTYSDQVVEPAVTSRRADDGTFTSASLDDMDPTIEIEYV